MTQRLVILGAGGFGREVMDVVEAINFDHATTRDEPFEVLGFLDDGTPDPETLAPYGVGHLGAIALLADMPADIGFVVGIGSPSIRRKLAEQYADRTQPVLIHPSVTMGRAVEIGDGSVLCAGVRLTNNVRVERHVHLNLNSTVGHDAQLGDYVTISPLVAISGHVLVGEDVMVGTGATLNPGVTVERGSTVGSGSVVLRDVKAGTTVSGVPARTIS